MPDQVKRSSFVQENCECSNARQSADSQERTAEGNQGGNDEDLVNGIERLLGYKEVKARV
jgi:hypothetical protein